MKFKRIGIDLGQNSIRMVSLDESSIQTSLEHSKEYFISYEDMDDYFSELKIAIKDFSKIVGSKLLKLNISLSYNFPLTISTFLDVPNIDKELLDKSITHEMQEVVDVDLDKYSVRWKEIEELDNGKTLRVLAIGVDREIIDSLTEMCSILWQIEKIEPQLSIIDRVTEGNTAIVDAGLDEVRIYSARDGKITDIDIIPQVYEGFKIDTDLEIDEKIKSIIELKKVSKLRKEEYKEELNALNTVLDSIRSSIRRIETEKMLMLDNIYLLGGLSNIPDFQKLLEEELLVPVEFISISALNQLYDEEVNEEDGLMSANDSPLDISDMGLLSDDEDTDKDEIDNNVVIDVLAPLDEIDNDYNEEHTQVLTEEEVEYIRESTKYDNIDEFDESPFIEEASFIFAAAVLKGQNKYLRFENKNVININVDALLIGVLTAALTLNIGVFGVSKHYNKKIETANTELSEIVMMEDDINSKNQSLMNLIEDHRNTIDSVISIKEQKKWLSDMLFTLSKETPNGAAIEAIQIYDKEVTIEGYAKDYRNIGYLSIALEKYGEIDIHEVDVLGDNVIDGMTKKFEITLSHNNNLGER